MCTVHSDTHTHTHTHTHTYNAKNQPVNQSFCLASFIYMCHLLNIIELKISDGYDCSLSLCRLV